MLAGERLLHAILQKLTSITLHNCRMAHRGDYPGEFQGRRLERDEVTTQSDWEEPGEGHALSPTTSPKAPRGPKA